MQKLYKSRAHRGRNTPTIKRTDAEAIQIRCPQRDENGDNKNSGGRGYIN